MTRIAIVGGGIGGAAAALGLSREGFDVVLLEQARQISEVGAGLQVSANGTRALRYLGVLDAFHSRVVRAKSYRIMQFETGELVHEHPLMEHFGEQAYEAHRADLLEVLMQALPEGVVRTQSKCIRVEQTTSDATVVLENGDRVVADLVIGADGVHSAVRASLFGPDDPIFAGKVVWRSLIPADRIAHLDLPQRFHGWRGLNRIAVGYWARPENVFNFAAFVPADEMRRESWSQRGEHADLVKAMEGCEPLLQSLVDASTESFITAMYFRRPLDRWTEGRITLLGDAAHPMLPYMAQGAVQAIEDAVVLARCLGVAQRQAGSLTDALEEYEARRRPRTSKVQANVLALREFWFSDEPLQRMGGMRRMQAQDVIDPHAESQWGWVYRYDPTLEPDLPIGANPAMSGSRAQYEPVWPVTRGDQRWARIFEFDDLATGHTGLRQGIDRYFSSAVVHRQERLGDVPCLRVDGEPDGDALLLVHGGGFVAGSAAASLGLAGRLRDRSGASVVIVDHRLSPEYAAPAAMEDVCAAYRGLVASGVSPERIHLVGESSGGGIALAAVVTLRDAGVDLPASVTLLSPFADMTLSGESMAVNGFSDTFVNRDRLLDMATSYYQLTEPRDAMVSPLFGNLEGLPPILAIAARDEALASDAVRVVQQAVAAGTPARLVLADTATHAFPVFEDDPHSDAALDLIGWFTTGAAHRRPEQVDPDGQCIIARLV